MNISQVGIDLIKSFEGFSPTPYKCLPTEKYWTIGFGHYGEDVKTTDKITKEKAEKLLKKDLKRFIANVRIYHKIYKFTQNEFDALCSFAYNVGSIDELTKHGTRTKTQISNYMLLYCNSGGRRIDGLYKRRLKEQELYNTPYATIL